MIDFTKIQDIIPKDGSLVLSFTKTEETVSVLYAPKVKGKETSEEFAPMLLKGTAEELNAGFADAVTDVARKLDALAQLQATKTVSKTAAKKSGQITKAITKASSGNTTKALPSTTAKAAPAKPEEPKAPETMDLFSPPLAVAPPPPPAAVEPAAPASTDTATTEQKEVKDAVNC